MKIQKTNRVWLALGGLLAALGLTLILAYGGAANPPPPRVYRTVPPIAQDHATGGPYIERALAEAVALRVGSAPGAVVRSDFLTIADATRFLGFRPVDYYRGDDLEVWLILVHGPYTASFSRPGIAPPTADHYYVVIDATKGEILGTGAPTSKSW